MKKYPRIVKQELVSGKMVEMLDEGFTFGQHQYFVYIEDGDGTRSQFGPSEHTEELADEVFKNAVAQAVNLAGK